MTGNELFEPLTGPVPTSSRRLPGLIGFGAGLALVACCWIGMRTFDGPGLAGRSAVVGTLETTPPAPAPAPQATQATPAQPVAADVTGSVHANVRTVGQTVEIQNGVKIYRPVMGATGVMVPVTVPSDEQAVDTARLDGHGTGSTQPAGQAPRVALLFGGLGFDRIASARAAAILPATVTFGFTPYGDALEAQVQLARNAGHPIVLQLPMEGQSRSGKPPDHMLTTDPARAPADLAWLLNRFRGFDGVSNLLGARVLADDAALRPIVEAVAARDLYFLEDGGLPATSLATLGHEFGLPTTRADVVLDARRGSSGLQQDLARLEDMARRQGSAIGTVIASPGTADVLARFAARLPERGVDLVSVGEVVRARRATSPAGLALSR